MIVALVISYPSLAGYADPALARWTLILAWIAGSIAALSSDSICALSKRLRIVCSLLIALTLGGVLYWADIAVTTRREEMMLPLSWKPPQEFKGPRKRAIRHALIEFREWLRLIQFPLQEHVPPIGISAGGTKVFSYLSYGPGEVYKYVLSVRPEEIDDPKSVVRLYANYEVSKALFPGAVHSSTTRFVAVACFGSYLAWSFYGSPQGRITADQWTDALWDIRANMGKDFADSLAVYTVRSFRDGPPSVSDEDKKVSKTNSTFINDEIYSHVLDALQAIDNGSNIVKVKDIIKQHGIVLKRSFQ